MVIRKDEWDLGIDGGVCGGVGSMAFCDKVCGCVLSSPVTRVSQFDETAREGIYGD